jgi:hypothetical protein
LKIREEIVLELDDLERGEREVRGKTPNAVFAEPEVPEIDEFGEVGGDGDQLVFGEEQGFQICKMFRKTEWNLEKINKKFLKNKSGDMRDKAPTQKSAPKIIQTQKNRKNLSPPLLLSWS